MVHLESKQIKMASLDEDVRAQLIHKIFEHDLNGVKSILLSNNCTKVEINDKDDITLLQHAAFKGNKEIVRFLLDQGADVNCCKNQYRYSALHFAALSGNPEICQLLLENGAKPHATTTHGRTPSQMAAFIGNHACATVVNNFIPKSDIEFYTAIPGLGTEPKLPPHLSDPLHKFVMQVNLHPVKIAINLQKSKSLYDNLDKIVKVLELMSEREMKRGFESNEIMSFKFHYLSYILKHISLLKKSQLTEKEGDKKDGEKPEKDVKNVEATELFIKQMLKIKKGPYPENQERFLRGCIKAFPSIDCIIFRQMLITLARADSPSALSVIICAVNGQRGFADSDNSDCATCHEEKAIKKCAKCRSVQYCDRECQKYHWFIHKKQCDQLAAAASQNEESKEEAKEEETSTGAGALAPDISTMNVN